MDLIRIIITLTIMVGLVIISLKTDNGVFKVYFGFAVMYSMARAALGVDALWLQIAIVSITSLVTLLITAVLLIQAHVAGPHLDLLRKAQEKGTAAAVLNVVALLTVVLIGFAALQALLLQFDAVSLKGGPSEDYLNVSIAYYLWQVIDAIPALDIPDTLNLTLAHPFDDHLSGSLALAFRFIFIFAFLRLFAVLIWDSLNRKGLIYQHQPSA